jgi:hypothetical protein
VPIARQLAAAVAIAAVLGAGGPAAAATRVDPDDVPGRLDIAEVSRTFTNGPAAPPMVHLSATTYDRWKLRQCDRVDACSFTFEVNALDVYWATHRGRTGRLRERCLVLRGQEVVAHGVSTKLHRSVFCSFRKLLLHADRPVRWRVRSLWGTTVDAAPDAGRY